MSNYLNGPYKWNGSEWWADIVFWIHKHFVWADESFKKDCYPNCSYKILDTIFYILVSMSGILVLLKFHGDTLFTARIVMVWQENDYGVRVRYYWFDFEVTFHQVYLFISKSRGGWMHDFRRYLFVHSREMIVIKTWII